MNGNSLSLLCLLIAATPLALCVGCGDDFSPILTGDAAADTARDTNTDDGAADASEDTANDAAEDSSEDVAEDVAEDTGADATNDGASDSATDATSDSGEDAASDAGEDSSDDAGADGGGSGAVCEDYVPPPPAWPPCTDAIACDEICFAPGRANCGVCMPDTCVDDTECGDGDFCVGLRASCACSGNGVATACLPDCSTADCPSDDYACVARGAGMACVFKSCADDAWECGKNTMCDPSDANADIHGCVRAMCAVDSDCECGSCIGARCHSGPGTCQPPAP